MRRMILVMIGCSAPSKPAPAPAPPPAPARDLAVAEPAPKREPVRDFDPRDPMWVVDERPGPVVPMRRPQQEIVVAASDLWSPCVREYVQAQASHARRPLTAMIARHVATCDDQRRVLITPHGQPVLAFSGTFPQLELFVTSCSAFEAITIAHDGKRWTSGRLVTEERDGCTIAAIPNTPSTRAMLRDVVDAKDAVIRFGSDEVALPEALRRDLRLVLDAIDAVSGP